MSLDAMIAITLPEMKLVDIIDRFNTAFIGCESVLGLYSVKRLVFPPPTVPPVPREEEILLADDPPHLDRSALLSAASDIANCPEGLEVKWSVLRYEHNRERGKIETFEYVITLRYRPVYTRYSLKETIYIDARNRFNYQPLDQHEKPSSEAAALNLELLIDELSSLTEVPVARMFGIPEHIIDRENPLPMNEAWLYYDGHRHYDKNNKVSEDPNLSTKDTQAGPIYYATNGVLYDMKSLELPGSI